MRIRSGLVIPMILVLVLGLAFTGGCRRADDNGNNGNGGDNGNGGPGNGIVDIDFSDPDEVALAFLADYSAGNFTRAVQYLTDDAKYDLEDVVDEYTENPYILDFWKLVVRFSDAVIVGRGSSGNWMTFNIELSRPDFEAIMDTEDGEELVFDVLILLALSGIDMGEINDYAAESKKTFSESAWNTAFAALKSAIEDLPLIKENITIELIETDGEWKVDRIPFTDLF